METKKRLMKNKVGIIFMGAGTLLIMSAFILLYWNQKEAWQAKNQSKAILSKMVEYIEDISITDFTEKVVEIEGYSYMGYLSIPALGLELPVMSGWDYSRMKIAPCRYSGTVEMKNLVIAAHNYPGHFGRISELTEDDNICFTGANGVISSYRVVSVDILDEVAVEEMIAGEYDLTLFTCTYSGQSRVTVRCEKE